MSTSRLKFPRRVRIHGGECGAVARALHHAAQKDALMSYEHSLIGSVDLRQAEPGNVLGSTFIERKQMSTKTTLKRIALVAVSVLGLGFLNAAPSSAAQADSFTSATTTSSVATNAAATVDLTLSFIATSTSDAMTVTPVLMSGPSTNAKWGKDVSYAATTGKTEANLDAVNSDLDGNAVGALIADPTAATLTVAYRTASFTPTVAGTYVFKFTASGGVNNSSVTWTITATDPAVLASKAFISATTIAVPTVDDASTLLTASATTADLAKARIAVNQYSNAGGTTLIADAYASAVTVAISGAGSVGLADSTPTRGPSVTALAGDATNDFFVFSDGRTGTAVITITVGATVITKSFVFFGSGAGVKQDVTVAPKALVGIGETDSLTFRVTDSLGNLTGNNTSLDFATSSNTAVATVTAADGVVTVTGVAVGTATITVCNTASCTAATLSGSTTVTVASATVAKVTMAFDKDTYTAGEKMTLTVKAFDAAGGAIADGARNLFTTDPVSNVAGFVAPADNVTLKNGSATYTYYAPLASGVITFAGTDSTTAAAAVTVSANVSNPAQAAADAATDAANEAIDAANAATDAANLAAEAADAATVAAEEARDAADAATAAVEELATQVATLMAALKAQITTLANTVAKIAKKVKA